MIYDELKEVELAENAYTGASASEAISRNYLESKEVVKTKENMENRKLSIREVECIRKHMIKHKDRANLKRLKKRLIKLDEYKFLMREYRKTSYKIITY